MTFDTPENLNTIFECISILNEEINNNACSKGGTEVFFKLMELTAIAQQVETTDKWLNLQFLKLKTLYRIINTLF